MLRVQRRLAAGILKCGINRIQFDPEKLTEIKEAITKTDIRILINQGAISTRRLLNTSKYWARINAKQKSKGKRKGVGSRKGKKTARTPSKRSWMNKIRLQRGHIKNLRDKSMISTTTYHELYMKSKGGFFRSIGHLKLYVQEKGLIKK
ncbi:MAG TPA: 50S ribosomal protein L19e [Candidatus Nanoarchaeia archaeon]|nr:50S ribosomal protein L19e [Candidatus Nanoarchaeia archaeon]